MMAGALPDTPAARVDPNTTTSAWAGVGSITLSGSPGTNFSGVLIGNRYVLTAAHVVNGVAAATITFNLNYGGNLSHQIPAVATYKHPNYVGFGTPNLNNDIAIIELASPVPYGVPTYQIFRGNIAAGTTLTMVGYGDSGPGNSGVTVGRDPAVKRIGRNNADYFVTDDQGSGVNELFYYDFDGAPATNIMGGGTLGNAVETSLAGGDSGGPSFVRDGSGWSVAGINTFVAAFTNGPTTRDVFGTGGGGQLVAAYAAWIDTTISGADQKYNPTGDIPTLPEWAMILMAGSLLLIGVKRGAQRA